jgi:ketosteroid isomerase-like protein
MTDRSPIEEEWEIRRLAYLYARAMDRNEPETIDRIFTEDAVLARPTVTWSGRAEIRKVPGWLHERCVNLTHHVHNQLAEVTGDAATAETYGLSHLVQRGPSGNLYVFEQGIRYQDSLVRQAGVWRCARRELVYDWTETRTVQLGDQA